MSRVDRGSSTDSNTASPTPGPLGDAPSELAPHQDILDQIVEAIFLFDRSDLKLSYVNRGAVDQTGYSTAELLDMRFPDLYPDYGEARFRALVEPVISGQKSAVRFETTQWATGKGSITVNVLIHPIRVGRRNDQLIAIVQDITQAKESRRRLQIAASVFKNSYEAIMITDARNRVLDVNPAFVAITGYGRDEIIGQDPKILSSGRHDPDFYKALWDNLNANGYWRGEIWNRRKDGNIYPELLSISRVTAEDDKDCHHVAIFSDISLIKNHQKELDRAVNYDPLTNLPNRHALSDLMEQAVAHASRYRETLAVCFVELDGFKRVNDRFGHDVGDTVLKVVAERLKFNLRAEDAVSRLGGDEFVLLIRNADGDVIFDRLIRSIAKPIQINEKTIKLSASIGITVYPRDKSDSDGLLRHAAIAMYGAKEEGRNRYGFFDPIVDAERKLQRDKVKKFAAGLAQGEMALHFQPQINQRTGRIVGFEALVRWYSRNGVIIPPIEFLPAIEGGELDVRLGDWVLHQAIEAASNWWPGFPDIGVSINISPAQLLSKGFVDGLQTLLRERTDIDPSRIHLEILESTAIADINRASHIISRCRNLGLQVALDDFGTGFSSLSYLRSLPIDQIKIDRSFVIGMLNNPDDRTIVESIIYLADKFQRTVVAEGVETDQHAQALAQVGCDILQGYGISRPMEEARIDDWIRNWTARTANPDPSSASIPEGPQQA